MIILDCDSRNSLQQITDIRAYFRDYLIARQLNDDLHDWKDDLRRGHANFVVTFLLRSSRIKPGAYDIERLIEKLQIHFWKVGLDRLHAMILQHTDSALMSAQKSRLFINDAPFISMTIQPIIDSVHEGRAIVSNKKDYLKAYTSGC